MKDIPDFRIDKWISKHSGKARISLHGSNVRALTLKELQELSPDASPGPINVDLQLGYGTEEGTVALRQRIAELHSSETTKLTAENVIITPGSIMANFLALTTLFGPGDHVICQYPTFAQLYAVPKYYGAEVTLWRMKPEDEWNLKVEDLSAMIKSNTKAIIINNPNNPTGSVIRKKALEHIIEIAQKHDLTVFSDEVFSPLFHTEEPPPPPFVSLGYPRSLSTGSMSKALALPGIRLGWVVSPDLAFLDRLITAREYTTIAASQLDEGVAAYALSPNVLPHLLERNLAICKTSIRLLEQLVKDNPGRCALVSPKGAGTAFLQILNPDGSPADDAEFAKGLVESKEITVLPGEDCFGSDGKDPELKGFLRIALGEDIHIQEGLPVVSKYLAEYLS